MNFATERWLGIIAGLIAGLGLLWYLYGPQIEEKIMEAERSESPADPPRPPATVNPGPRFPVPDAATAPGAPGPATAPDDLASADETLRAALANVFGKAPIEAFLIEERIVQNIVATVDSLDREPVPLRYRALGAVGELPVVETHDDTMHLAEDNADRYAFLVGTLERTDARKLTAVYLRYYPLFQRAYRELGYPSGYFNDRVVTIIDHLLAAPEPARPVALTRPKVLYQFADPALEALSSGQKLMIRIGPENAAIVKRKLAEIRAILAQRGTETGAPRDERR